MSAGIHVRMRMRAGRAWLKSEADGVAHLYIELYAQYAILLQLGLARAIEGREVGEHPGEE